MTTPMTWECKPELNHPELPAVQTVEFTFADAPEYRMVTGEDHACDILKAAGRPLVNVQFLVWGNTWSGYAGYKTEAVDGRPFYDSTPWGYSEDLRTNPRRPFPLDGHIPTHRLF